MNITTEKTGIGLISKPEIEQVQKQKHEYYLLGTFRITKGLRLFGYNYIKEEVFEVEIKNGKNIHLDVESNKLAITEKESESVMIDSRFIYFEALNIRSANNRIIKFKQGKIKELFNLKKPNLEGIKFF